MLSSAPSTGGALVSAVASVLVPAALARAKISSVSCFQHLRDSACALLWRMATSGSARQCCNDKD